MPYLNEILNTYSIGCAYMLKPEEKILFSRIRREKRSIRVKLITSAVHRHNSHGSSNKEFVKFCPKNEG